MIDPPRLFFDADAIIAGSVSQSGASFLLLQLCELGLLRGVTSEMAIEECRRNLSHKFPMALPLFEEIVSRALTILPPPKSTVIEAHQKMADPKDLIHLATAAEGECQFLVTFNTKDYSPDGLDLKILSPGDMLREIRRILVRLGGKFRLSISRSPAT